MVGEGQADRSFFRSGEDNGLALVLFLAMKAAFGQPCCLKDCPFGRLEKSTRRR